MSETEGSTRIAADADAVMAVITDFESYPEWAGVERSEIRSRDADGRATEVAFDVSASAMSASYTLAFDHAKDGRGLSWRSTEAAGVVKQISGAYRLDEEDGETVVSYELSVEPAIPLPGFMRRQAERKIVETALQGLKRRVEEG